MDDERNYTEEFSKEVQSKDTLIHILDERNGRITQSEVNEILIEKRKQNEEERE